MGLKTMSLLASATVAASGGTALAFAESGVSILNGVQLIVPADTDYQTRRVVTAKFRSPTLDARTGVYGKDKKSLTYVKPIVLSTGQVVFNTIRVEREVHPSVSAADCIEMNKIGAQMLIDADTDVFWGSGGLT